MDRNSTRSHGSSGPAATTTAAHASGEVLFAVAEGDPGHQPDETTLAHIFDCAQCSQTVREIRMGLNAFATALPHAPSAPAARGAARPVAPRPESSLGDFAALPSAKRDPLAVDALLRADSDGDEEYARSRKLIVKVVIVGVLLVVGLLFMKSFAAGMR